MAKFVQAFRKFFGLKTTTCHGCNVKPSPNEYEEKLAVGADGSSKVKYILCSDCLKDLK